ncbi:hypothetical protein [uncultured Methanolobus sp.]|uniref:hypothetical protein n=1 Tax=uncultured Methanolobus sp. TaxID=218300 RepID=UPI002AAB3AC3|nr:hypothetical protein [uncultured Methanolobus sp.]
MSNSFLYSKALKIAEEILLVDCPAARWIARDAIRELTQEKVKQKLLSKKVT